MGSWFVFASKDVIRVHNVYYYLYHREIPLPKIFTSKLMPGDFFYLQDDHYRYQVSVKAVIHSGNPGYDFVEFRSSVKGQDQRQR